MRKEGFKYICTVDVMLEYMKQEIEFAINNKLEMATDFYILYKDKEHHVCILNDLPSFLKSQAEIKTNIYFDNENYSSLDDFKNNAKLDGFLIKDIKENLNIILTYTDSVYLEEHQIKSTEKKEKIIFAPSKSFCNVFLRCAIFLSIFTIATRWMFKGQSGAIIAYIFFDLLALFSIYLYIYYKKKKIVYEKDSITVYGILKKEKYLLKDIVKVVEEEFQTKGITIYFKNNKRINFNFSLENYNDIKKILQQNNIQIIYR